MSQELRRSARKVTRIREAPTRQQSPVRGSRRATRSKTPKRAMRDSKSPYRESRSPTLSAGGSSYRSRSRQQHGSRRLTHTRSETASEYETDTEAKKLEKMHKEICPNYRDGCLLGFRCQRLHDYTQATTSHNAKLLDIILGQLFETRKLAHMTAELVVELCHRQGIRPRNLPSDFRSSTRRDSHQIRRRSVSLGRRRESQS